MYDAWCDECGGYLYTESHGVVTDAWESRDAAERVMRQHHDSNGGEYDWHTVYVARCYELSEYA